MFEERDTSDNSGFEEDLRKLDPKFDPSKYSDFFEGDQATA